MDQKVELEQQAHDRVECRPTGSGYALAAVIGLVALILLFAVPHQPQHGASEQIAFRLFLGFLWLMAFGAAWWDFHACIVADAAGLRWRHLASWRSAAWSDVDDFYLQSLYPPTDARSVYLVRTTSGTLRIAPSGWTNVEELRRIVAARASNPPAEGWAPLGARSKDGDVALFPYDTLSARAQAGGFLAAGLWLTASYLFFLVTEWDQVHGRSFAEAMPALFILLVFAAIGLPMVWLSCRLAWLWWRHRNEVIEVTSEGLVRRSRDGQQSIPWDQVVAYGFNRERFLKVDAFVRSATGDEIRVEPILPRQIQLQAMIQRLAARSSNRVWQLSEPDHLGGARLRKRDGARVFHYRTRTNRAMLWFGGTYATLVWLPLIRLGVGIWPEDAPLSPPAALALALATDAAFLWVVLCYYRSAVLIDERGLVRETPLGQKCLAWMDIREIGKRGSWPGKRWYVRGSDVEIRFESQITDLEELQREITTRAPQAEGSWPVSAESLPVTTP